jgi:UDP-GlcNAc:undecaprenyl-phosphate GlcNAc-1-phosphate transferase
LPAEEFTLADIIRTYWPILAVSFGVSVVATPVCRRVALARGIVDKPDDFLKPHQQAIPYLGGVAMFLGWAVGLVLALCLFAQPTGGRPGLDLTMVIGIFVAGLAIMLLGLFDDLRLASPVVKLAGAAAVSVLLILVGIGDDAILVMVRSTGIKVGPSDRWLVLCYSVPLTLFITIGACNATNLIDGLDGLCSGVLGIISAGFLVLAVHLYLKGRGNEQDAARLVLCLAMLGAALGFLPFNRNPAKIFMGDAGSMLLGLNAAVLLLLFAKSNASRWMFGSVMVFGVPLADMLLTLVRRWRNQKPLMQGDRSHFYDQLIDRGLPVRTVVGISYALAVFFAVMGCASIVLRTRYLLLLYAVVTALLLVAVAKFKMVRLETGPQAADHSGGPGERRAGAGPT